MCVRASMQTLASFVADAILVLGCQNDKKMLTPKALVGEIRSLYEKNRKPSSPAETAVAKAKDSATDTRQNADKVATADQTTPSTHASGLSFDYHNLSVHQEVFSVLSYAVECGSVSKSEKVYTPYICAWLESDTRRRAYYKFTSMCSLEDA